MTVDKRPYERVFILCSDSTDAFVHLLYRKGEIHTERVELVRPVNLTLECTWTGNANNLRNITGFWRKDGLEIENSRLTVQPENEQYNLKRE